MLLELNKQITPLTFSFLGSSLIFSYAIRYSPLTIHHLVTFHFFHQERYHLLQQHVEASHNPAKLKHGDTEGKNYAQFFHHSAINMVARRTGRQYHYIYSLHLLYLQPSLYIFIHVHTCTYIFIWIFLCLFLSIYM